MKHKIISFIHGNNVFHVNLVDELNSCCRPFTIMQSYMSAFTTSEVYKSTFLIHSSDFRDMHYRACKSWYNCAFYEWFSFYTEYCDEDDEDCEEEDCEGDECDTAEETEVEQDQESCDDESCEGSDCDDAEYEECDEDDDDCELDDDDVEMFDSNDEDHDMGKARIKQQTH